MDQVTYVAPRAKVTPIPRERCACLWCRKMCRLPGVNFCSCDCRQRFVKHATEYVAALVTSGELSVEQIKAVYGAFNFTNYREPA